MAEGKLLSLLGLARRAGKLEAGFDAAVAAAKGKKAFLLIAASDISEKTYKNICFEAERAEIPAVRVKYDTSAAGNACGKKAGVFAVTDKGFADALKNAAEKEEQCL